MLGTCPSCGEERALDKEEHLRCAQEAFFAERSHHTKPGQDFYPLEDGFQVLAAEGHKRWFWACDKCIESGQAIAANITLQNVATGTPFAAYVDRAFRCTDCGADSVFRPKEQQLWYEDYGFLIWSHPKQCLECRRVRRDDKATHQKLADALSNLDLNDADSLDAIADLYEALGSAKATVFRRRAKNARRQ